MGKDLLTGELGMHECEDLFGRRGVASDPAEELDRDAAFQGEADVVTELTGAHLDDGEGAGASRKIPKLPGGERVEGNGPEEARLDTARAGLFDDGFEDTADDPVTDQDEI